MPSPTASYKRRSPFLTKPMQFFLVQSSRCAPASKFYRSSMVYRCWPQRFVRSLRLALQSVPGLSSCHRVLWSSGVGAPVAGGVSMLGPDYACIVGYQGCG